MTLRPQVIALFIFMMLMASAQLTRAQALNWPEKPIRVIVPYTPGGGTDALTRQLVERLSAQQKWSFVVENRPGGGGNIGLEGVSKSKPDGYTFGMGQTANLAINPAAMQKMPFDAQRDLVPVALIAEQPTILIVKADAPFKNFAELMKAAKENTQALKLASAGSGTVGHLAAELLSKRAGVHFLHIPYKGAVPAITDLMGGQTDFMFATPQAVLGLLKGGRLRALTVSSSQRMHLLPEVPTVAESGYVKFQAVDWKVLVAPAATPLEIQIKLNAAIERVLSDPKFIEQLTQEGSAALGGQLSRVASFVKEEQAQWEQVVQSSHIKLEP